MAEVRPFRAFFYADRLRKALNRLVCPPYDVISSAEQRRLLGRDALNFVRVELPSDPAARKYARAARLWRRWAERGVVRRDDRPAFYLYETAFRSRRTGRRRVRRGFFAALRLVPWGRGVFPHEKTLPTPKADRLRLFKALHVQTSPIHGLFRDDRGAAGRILALAARRRPWRTCRDDDGATHRLWRLDDADAKRLQRLLRRSPVVIADGHHRYETSLAYAAGRRGADGNGCVMAYLCPSGDRGLEILPTHRAVDRSKQRYVRPEPWGGERPAAGLKVLLKRLDQGGAPFRREFGVAHNGRFSLFRFRSVPPALRGTPLARLAVACLHAGPLRGLGKEDFFFTRSPEEAVAWARGRGGWAFLLAPNTVRQVVDVAVAGRVMPPKSTYFYPKIPSGLLSHALRGEL